MGQRPPEMFMLLQVMWNAGILQQLPCYHSVFPKNAGHSKMTGKQKYPITCSRSEALQQEPAQRDEPELVPMLRACMLISSAVSDSFVTQWSVARQVPPSMGFSRQEYWSGLPFPPPGDLPDPRIKTMLLTSPASAGRFFTTSTIWEIQVPVPQ